MIATRMEFAWIALLIPKQLVRSNGGLDDMARHLGQGSAIKFRLGLQEVEDLSALSAQTASDLMEGGQKRKRCGQVNDKSPYRNHHPSPELEQSLAQYANLSPGTGCTRSSQT